MSGEPVPVEGSGDWQRALGAAVRDLRQRAGLSEVELAVRAELDPGSIVRLEAGEIDPNWGDARRIAQALGIPLDELAELVERLEEEDPG